MMKYAIVYSSRTGNTRLLADTLHTTLPAEDCIYFGTPSPEALAAGRVYVGFWTDKGTCDEDVAAFLKSLPAGKEVYLFGTAGFGGSAVYFDKILNAAAANLNAGVALVGRYMCQGKMPEAVRRKFESMPESPRRQAMLDNFDQALTHPDTADLTRLETEVRAGL